MPSQTETYSVPIGGGITAVGKRTRSWTNSPRINGKLRLKSNAYSDSMDKPLRGMARKGAWWLHAAQLNAGTLSLPSRLQSESYARLRGKLYKGSAALGVTIGSYKQSRDMIVQRYGTLSQKADRAVARLITDASPRNVAGIHLEVIFGWVPLISDVVATTTTVCQLADLLENVTGRASAQVPFVQVTSNGGHHRRVEGSVKFMHTRSALVRIENPNRWLLERAGLLNPAAVAWDLVPWSFVVNMFVNTGQLVNSITDFAGLSFNDSSTTSTARCRSRQTEGTSTDPTYYGWNEYMTLRKTRKLGSGISRPPLTWKIPEANWETAAMAASLFTQKFSKLASLIPRNHVLR